MKYDLVQNKEQILKRRKIAELKMKKIHASSSNFEDLSRDEIIIARDLTANFELELATKMEPEQLPFYFDYFHGRTKNFELLIRNNEVLVNKNQLIHLAELTNALFCVSFINQKQKNSIIF